MLTFVNNNHKKIFMAIRAVNHQRRQEIITHLRAKGRCCVTSIYYDLKMEQSVASQHLKVLRDVRVVQAERVGKHRHYTLDTKRLDEIDALASMLS
jgi:DNA-binding transcriptional ArsR family regulator